MQKKFLLLLAMVCLTAAGAWVTGTAAENPDRGAAEMVLEGGGSGDVPFPHRRHQEALKDDCQLCHQLFPRERGSIEQFKAGGKLEPKLVMNKLCTSCHRQYRRDGKQTGPITCSQCHQR